MPPHKLLLADDSVTIQRVIELTFAEEDIQVITVGDGDQAIAHLDADPPDIVLADIAMPGRNGYEVAAYVKGTPRLAHIPVVLLTGAFEPVDQSRADAAGCDGVLAKPFEPQLVISRVKDLLARPAPAPAAHDAATAPSSASAATPWTPSPADQPSAVVEPASKPAVDDEDYFDRLDAAFASLSGGAAGAKRAGPTAPNPLADSIGVPLSYGSPQAEFTQPPAQPPTPQPPTPLPAPPQISAPQAVAPPVAVPPADAPQPAVAQTVAPPPPPASRRTLPPLADAFAALLAAEQTTSTPAGAPHWPASPHAPAPAPDIVVTDDLIEAVTRRVLERLSDKIVRDTVSDVVSATAERLVRDEIDRIKGTIP